MNQTNPMSPISRILDSIHKTCGLTMALEPTADTVSGLGMGFCMIMIWIYLSLPLRAAVAQLWR
jgi:hypothetical protein